jgi:AraC-like DNA-binding protein
MRGLNPIHENMHGRIRLSEIASECGLSVSHLARSFKTSFGNSIHRWVLQLRVDHAKQLMNQTSMSLIEIAIQSGFNDQAAFTRIRATRRGQPRTMAPRYRQRDAFNIRFCASRSIRAATQEGNMTTTQSKPSIVFCHGHWADGSYFNKLIVPLQSEGYECIAAQYGLNTTAEDVTLVKATSGSVSRPVILVGHSYGGSLITGAGTDDRVVGLVYICALAPDADETPQTQHSKFPTTDVFSHIEVVDGRIWLRPEGTKYFCGDLSEQEQKLVRPTQSVPQPDLFESKVIRTLCALSAP